MDWFERITGFAEQGYAATKELLAVADGRLTSTATTRSYAVGQLEITSLQSLRERTRRQIVGRGPSSLGQVRGDVRHLHQLPENIGALFQVASQFNLLEMIGPDVSPEDGVTRYQSDPTQGPACAIAAGAATIYRNYFAPVGDSQGQTHDLQINCLDDLGAEFGHIATPLWSYRNGYPLCSGEGLDRIARHLDAANNVERNRLLGRLKVGIHWDVEVTDASHSPGPLVSQAFCSALPVAYSKVGVRQWEPFARLVLDAAYEATLLTAVVNSIRPAGSHRVLLTRLGGGSFGNEAVWIDAAIARAMALVAEAGLDVIEVIR